MVGSKGELSTFWSNGLVGSITTLALTMLFWPLISNVWRKLKRASVSDRASSTLS
jgi:TctA family transporter